MTSRLTIFWRVLVIHLVLLLGLVLLPTLSTCQWFEKEEVVMAVDLSTLPPPVEVPPDEPDKTDEPEDAVIPATPEPRPTPTPTPVPTPTPAEEARPEPTATPVPTATPAPTATPKPTAKPAPTPTPTPRSRLLTPEEIRARIEQQQNNTPRPRPTLDPNRLETILGEGLQNGNAGSPNGGVTTGSSGGDLSGVRDELYSRLKAQWKQPVGLGGRTDLFVDVSVRVERDGRISSARILKASGHPEMDQSVSKALDNVKRVRRFPADNTRSGETFEFRFKLQ